VELVEAVGKPPHVAVFGTGETQWGEEYYCGAVRRMAAFFDTGYPRLEIEQMPHGNRDTLKIERWTDHVLAMAAGGSSSHPTNETTAPCRSCTPHRLTTTAPPSPPTLGSWSTISRTI